MARRIRVPWLVDVLLVDDPHEIGELAAEPRLDRRFDPVGPLVNRVIAHRMRANAAAWPAHTGPGPARRPPRAERQAALEKQLDPRGEKPLWDEGHCATSRPTCPDASTRPSSARSSRRSAAGLSIPDYRASPESWQAAVLYANARLCQALASSLVVDLTASCGGRSELLARLAKDDILAFHSTTIGAPQHRPLACSACGRCVGIRAPAPACPRRRS